MLYHAKNGCLDLDGGEMDYLCFGSGAGKLVMLPGLGDGLKTAKGMALPFALMYRSYARDYQVYVFSRREPLEEGCTTRDMARDVSAAMEQLGIGRASVIGVSQGGMIAQYLAADWPEKVEKLVLTVSAARCNETAQAVIGHWIALAEAGNYKEILVDTAEKSYTQRKLRGYRLLYPLLGSVGKPRDFSRFLIQARACLNHDAQGVLRDIRHPTLIVGGEEDRILGGAASRALAKAIPQSKLVMYPEYGHALYEEAADFNRLVLEFLNGG